MGIIIAPIPYVIPGTSGNVLTSNGSIWTSAAAAASSKQMVPIAGPISSPASTTYYIGFGTGTGLGTSGTANGVEFVAPLAGTFKNLYLFSYETLNGTAGQTIVYTLMKNNSAQTITVTQTVGDTTQNYSDLTHTFTVVAGDKICLRVVTGAITANSGRISGGGIEFDPS